MLPAIHPKQYQDVKANLVWYTTIILAMSGLIIYLSILPTKHKQILTTFFGQIRSSQLVGSGIIMVVFGFIGWLLIFVFEFHDKIYDRYFVRWRFYYDLYFILPFLVRPFNHKLDKNFFEIAKNYRYEFMKPFYHFVADYEHEDKISENLIVRFYEVVSKYWITQLNEIMLFFITLFMFIYYFIHLRLDLPLNHITTINFIIVALFLLNRLATKSSRKSVSRATFDEIEEIHNKYIVKLNDELRKLHNKFNLNYNDD